MSRTRTLPDTQVLAQVLDALTNGGDKAVSFGNLSRATGLAPATLAQRYGTVDGMIRAALAQEWDRLDAAVDQAGLDTQKGTQGYLKALPFPGLAVLSASLRDQALRERAEGWRTRVEAGLAVRRGGGTKGREAAALIFAAWQGRHIWDVAGGKAFRLADLTKRLG